MAYNNAALNISFVETQAEGLPQTIRHLIQASNFSRTASKHSTSLGTLGIMYNIHNNSTIINTVIDGCIFQETSASYGAVVFAHHRGDINSSVLTINRCEFSQQQAGVGDIVKIRLSDTNINEFSFLLNGSYFHDNSAVGAIVTVTVSRAVSSKTSRFIYASNKFINNTGYGLNIVMEAVNANHSIRESAFTNSRGRAINAELWCDHCRNNPQLGPTLELVDVSVEHNYPNTLQYDSVAVSLFGITLILRDSLFANNIGTALRLYDVEATFAGEVVFEHNVGRLGGALQLRGDTVILGDANVTFCKNFALFGGAMYIDTAYGGNCFIPKTQCFKSLNFYKNNATTNGGTIFATLPSISECFIEYYESCFNSTPPQTGTSAVSLAMPAGQIFTSISIFPGQRIPLDFIAKDYYNQSTSCVATALLRCGEQSLVCGDSDFQVKLSGASDVTLCTEPVLSNIWLQYPLDSNSTLRSDLKLAIHFKCYSSNQVELKLNVTDCPLGLAFNREQQVCECMYPEDDGQHFYICSARHGKACVKTGYWYGQIVSTNSNHSVTVLAPCSYTKCNLTAKPCPNDVSKSGNDFVLLEGQPDNQCSNTRGGIQCSACQKYAVATFEAIQCIPLDMCEPWQPYIILLLCVLFQLVLSFLIVIALRKNLVGETSYLYGPLLFIAVLDQLPFVFDESYYVLKSIISFYTSVFLLNLEVFGHIPWCFFPHLTPIENYAFHFLGPIIVATVLLGTVLLAHWCPKALAKVQESPVQAICLLILLSFCSVAHTSLSILIPVRYPGIAEPRVSLQPDLTYFSGIHILLGLISLLILLALVLPFILLLLLSPWLSTKVSCIHRIKPLLDEFQCCFKDNLRWYPAAYFSMGLLILGLNNYSLAVQVLLVAFATMHYFVQPYKVSWMNTVNFLLFCDLILVSALLQEGFNPYLLAQQGNQTAIIFFVHVLSLLPLMCITGGGVWIVLKSTNCTAHKVVWTKIKARITKQMKTTNIDDGIDSSDLDDNSVVLHKVIPTEFSLNASQQCLDREPLLGLLDSHEEPNQHYDAV